MPAFKEGWELPPKTTMLRTMIDQLEKQRYCNAMEVAELIRREELKMIVGGRATGCAV